MAKVLGRIRDKRLRIKGLFDEQYNEVSKVLSVRQRAQLVLFLKDFHKEIRSILRPDGSAGMSQDRGLMPRRPTGLPDLVDRNSRMILMTAANDSRALNRVCFTEYFVP